MKENQKVGDAYIGGFWLGFCLSFIPEILLLVIFRRPKELKNETGRWPSQGWQKDQLKI